MLQNKANSAVWETYFCSYFCLVCGGWGCKKNPQEFSRLRNWPISSADFPMTPMEGTEHHLALFRRRIFGQHPAAPRSPGPFVSLLIMQHSGAMSQVGCDQQGVQKSMGNKVPWKTGMQIYLPVKKTSRPLISLQKEAILSPRNFATTHLTACILSFHLP